MKLLLSSIALNIALICVVIVLLTRVNKDISVTGDPEAEVRLTKAMEDAIRNHDENGIRKSYNDLLIYKVANSK